MFDIMELGVQAIVILLVLFGLVIVGLHIMAQRSQQHMAEQSQAHLVNLQAAGLQAITGVNTIQVVDKAMERNERHAVTAAASSGAATATKT